MTFEIEKISVENDKPLFEKLLLAYYYSIPSDSPNAPSTIKINADMGSYYVCHLCKNDNMYGVFVISKKNVDRYIQKLNSIKDGFIPVSNDEIDL